MLWLICLISVIGTILAFSLIYGARNLKHLKNHCAQVETQLQQEIDKELNITAELEELKNNIAHNSLQDSLTGLPSRHVFEDRLLQTLNQSKRHQLTFGVLFLDVDAFKVINDALGHEVGDELLQSVATRLKESIRQVDTIGRFGSDQFVFILPQLSKAETAAYVAQRLLDIMAEPFQIRTLELFITGSIGIAVYPADGEDVQTLTQNAANALHQAKTRGRNVYQFYREEMHALSKRELVLNSSLRGASIYRDFSLYYQPQFNVETNKIIALDVLLHWHHPDFGLISLQEFLRLAENSGKILVIGEWMLRTALQQLQTWKQQGLNIDRIVVTVSLRQLENSHFAFKISQMLQEMHVDPSCLVLKISEGGLLAKLESIEKALYMLKHLGIQVAIDDFGTGHLALRDLKRFPADYLKIDRSLVQDITINKESEAIVKMIIALAKSLQIAVIADGVESPNQKQLLKNLECNIMQGSLFGGMPRRAEEFTQELVSHVGE